MTNRLFLQCLVCVKLKSINLPVSTVTTKEWFQNQIGLISLPGFLLYHFHFPTRTFQVPPNRMDGTNCTTFKNENCQELRGDKA